MKLTAHYINEGTTLILEGKDFRLGIETNEENRKDCDGIHKAIHHVDGVSRIAKERERQIEEENHSLYDDDDHTMGELADAALCYASSEAVFHCRGLPDCGYAFYHPWPQRWLKAYFKPSTYITHPNPTEGRMRDLEKAGALIAAEIDRLQRLSETTH